MKPTTWSGKSYDPTQPALEKGYLCTHYVRPNGRQVPYEIRYMTQEDFDWFTAHSAALSSEETPAMYVFYADVGIRRDDGTSDECTLLVAKDSATTSFTAMRELRGLCEAALAKPTNPQ